ncbi:CDP-alcohol phosphatidyltransferase family protein [Asanoa sp. WMMD1127]|uniref:CDP-alcohol phosphatidyltransferase family protein n=1 Tax=Asanoa sp. WMMD1127 TaxID=3016107 RepID=UPI00241810A6|nr:CDP-alcohol phosphatidyltransferase family protein [Asanoa sp. WMMD1127]MDG4823449.1 CDP-alcohol phosphatidyltransferase family protein [Asanoa sp. WMMD1127]
MRLVRSGPLVGMFAQFTVLAAVGAAVGIGAVGWFAGAAYAIVTAILLQHGLSSSGLKTYGPADWVTAARTTLIGVVAALVVDSLRQPPAVTAIVGLVVVALLLDGVDGQVARRTGTTSAFGARFDMEADSFLVLVLSLYVARDAGWWVLAIGGMRYAFMLGIWSTRWMRGTLPPRYWRKVVAATQGVALVTATAGILPFRVNLVLLLVAFALLVESFGRDVLWLWRDGHPVTRTRVIGRLLPRE